MEDVIRHSICRGIVLIQNKIEDIHEMWSLLISRGRYCSPAEDDSDRPLMKARV